MIDHYQRLPHAFTTTGLVPNGPKISLFAFGRSLFWLWPRRGQGHLAGGASPRKEGISFLFFSGTPMGCQAIPVNRAARRPFGAAGRGKGRPTGGYTPG